MAAQDPLRFFLDTVLPAALFLLGVGFLGANLRLLARFLRFWALRSSALLTWPGRRPSSYGVSLAFGVLFGVLVFVKIAIQQRPPADAFGEGMMFIYYAYAFPLSLRIGRGFYDDGIWSDRGFVPYAQIRRALVAGRQGTDAGAHPSGAEHGPVPGRAAGALRRGPTAAA